PRKYSRYNRHPQRREFSPFPTLPQLGVHYRGRVLACSLFFSRATNIRRTEERFARGFSTFILCSSESHCRISMSSRRTPHYRISNREVLKRSIVLVPISAVP